MPASGVLFCLSESRMRFVDARCKGGVSIHHREPQATSGESHLRSHQRCPQGLRRKERPVVRFLRTPASCVSDLAS